MGEKIVSDLRVAMAQALLGVHYQVREFMRSFDIGQAIASIQPEARADLDLGVSAPAGAGDALGTSGGLTLGSGWQAIIKRFVMQPE